MARGSLRKITESRWDLGEWQNGAVEDEPVGAAQTVVGLVGEDGKPYRRGGVSYHSAAAAGSAGLLGVWSGNLPAGVRTVTVEPGASVGTVRAYGDGGALTTIYTDPFNLFSGVKRMVVVAGILCIPVGLGQIVLYGGGLTLHAYAVGTVAVTSGSTAATGTGTAWSANAATGDLFIGPDGRAYTISAVGGNTSLTLSSPYAGSTVTGASYSIETVDGSALAGGFSVTGFIASVAGRLAAVPLAATTNVYFSGISDPKTFATTDFHTFPAPVVGMGALRDSLMVFTEAGAYNVSNMALDLTDALGNPQQQKTLVNADLIAWGHNGIASYRGALVVPALDGVWLMDSVSAPVRISDRIQDLYLSYVRAGYSAGVAEVFGGHYLLPILSGTTWIDTLVCKLTPSHAGNAYAWSQLSGFGAKVTAFAERSSSPPVLLGASSQTSSRVLNATSYFSPAAAVKNDADGTTHPFTFVTRDIPTSDNGRKNAVRYITAFYSLVDAASDNPTITAEASADGGNWQTLAVTTGTTGTTAGEQDGTIPVYWQANIAAENIRFRFTCTLPAASLQFKRLEIYVRETGRF